MLIPQEKISQSKEILGEKAAFIIAEKLGLEKFDEVNLKAVCPWHNEETPSLIWNPKENSYHCFSCNKNYGIIDLYMDIDKLTFIGAVEKLFEETKTEHRFSEKGVKTKKDYRYPKVEENKDRSVINKYWESRAISKETLEYANVGQDNEGNTVFYFYDTNDVLYTVKYKPSHFVKKGSIKTWAQKDADTTPLLYGMNQIDTTQTLLICEGEPDRLAVIESGFKNVVSVPFGAGNYTWIEENWDFLEQFKRIIVWSDNDDAGLAMRKEVCSRLGAWRTLYVDLPKEIDKNGKLHKVKDINEVLFYFGKETVLDFINDAKEIQITNIVDMADVEDFDIEKTPGLYSGFKEVDDIIYKFVLGTTVLVTGYPGSGKSSLLNQMFICEPLNQGMDVFVFSGEMPKPILRSWIEIQMAGRENVEVKQEHIRRIADPIKKGIRDWYRGRVWMYDNDDDNSLDSILNRAENVIRRFGVKVVILDNLTTIGMDANDTNVWQKQKELMVRLKNFAAKYSVLIVLVCHPKKPTINGQRLTGQDVAGSADLLNLTHYAFSLHRFSAKEKNGEKDKKGNGYKKGFEPIQHDTEIDFLKNRLTGRIGAVRTYFDGPSYRFYTKPSELWKRMKWSKDTSQIRTDDPNKHFEMPEGMND